MLTPPSARELIRPSEEPRLSQTALFDGAGDLANFNAASLQAEAPILSMLYWPVPP